MLLFTLLVILAAFLFYKALHSEIASEVQNSIFAEEAAAKQTAMVIVPHQDDEINLAGASIRTLREKGTRVIVVFVTNGDNVDDGIRRLREGLAAAKVLGVPEEEVVFLGYSNSMKLTPTLHLYNAGESEAFVAAKGFSQTYGLPEKPEFCYTAHKVHRKFTRANIVNDLQEVVLAYQPELLFVVDFDRHADHKVISLLFEEALGKILRRDGNTYMPQVYKGFAYNGSYLGKRDFYSNVNLQGEQPAEGEFLSNPPFDTDYPPYLWEERVRLPLCSAVLGRTLNSNLIYSALRKHFSQGIIHNAKRIVNSDQVFWRRRTASLSYQATVTVSSGEADCITDFKLTDTPDVLSVHSAFDGSWIPEKADTRRCLRMTFKGPEAIDSIVLYGNTVVDSCVERVHLQFSNGFSTQAGPLRPGSQASVVSFVRQQGIDWVEVRVLESRGQGAGINEIEVYDSEKEQAGLCFIKLMVKDCFAYDYWLPASAASVELSVYVYGFAQEPAVKLRQISGDDVTIDGRIVIFGKGFKRAVIRAEIADNTEIYDQIVITKKTAAALLVHKCVLLADMVATRLEHIVKRQYVKLFVKK